MRTHYRPTLIYDAGSFKTGQDLCVDAHGMFADSNHSGETLRPVVTLKDRALLPRFCECTLALFPKIDSRQVRVSCHKRQRLLVVARHHVSRSRNSDAG